MGTRSGSVPAGSQGQAGGTVALAGECGDRCRGARDWGWRGHPRALLQRRPDLMRVLTTAPVLTNLQSRQVLRLQFARLQRRRGDWAGHYYHREQSRNGCDRRRRGNGSATRVSRCTGLSRLTRLSFQQAPRSEGIRAAAGLASVNLRERRAIAEAGVRSTSRNVRAQNDYGGLTFRSFRDDTSRLEV